jgi:hypothetical protein
MQKRVRTIVINELKTLFLKTRHLDQSSKNYIIVFWLYYFQHLTCCDIVNMEGISDERSERTMVC